MVFGIGLVGELSWADLQSLVNNASETEAFEAKLEPPGTSDSEVREFCHDVCGMLNRGGGHIIYGLQEDASTRMITGITPFLIGGVPERLEQIIVSSISPVPRFYIVHIPDPSDGTTGCVAIWFPKNANEPFMVVRSGENCYWIRHNLTKKRMSEREIAESYQRRAMMYDRLESFLISESYGLIDDPDTYNHWASILTIPVPFDERLFVVSSPDVKSYFSPNNHPSPTRYSGGSILPESPVVSQRRLEFRLPYNATRLAETAALTYVRDNCCIVHSRNLNATPVDDINEIIGGAFCAVVYDGLSFAANAYREYVRSGEVVVCATLSKTSGTHLYLPPLMQMHGRTIAYQIVPIRRDVSFDEFTSRPGVVAKQIADEFYNSYGIDHSVCIDDEGNWNGDAEY